MRDHWRSPLVDMAWEMCGNQSQISPSNSKKEIVTSPCSSAPESHLAVWPYLSPCCRPGLPEESLALGCELCQSVGDAGIHRVKAPHLHPHGNMQWPVEELCQRSIPSI